MRFEMSQPLNHRSDLSSWSRLGIAGWIFVVGLFLIALFGGQLRLGATVPVEGQGTLYRALVARTEPAIGHALVGIPIVLAVAIAACRKGVLQISAMSVWVPLSAFFFWVAVAVPVSPTRYEAILDFARWVCAFAALIGSGFVLGRDKGPRIGAWSLFAGIAMLSIIGIAEFASMSRTAGNWRIFSGWHNPNALAGMLSLGLPMGLGLYTGATERLERLLLGFFMSANAAALWFTGSKGGIAAAAVAIIAFVLLVLLKKNPPAGWLKGLAVLAVGGAVLVGLLGFGAYRAGTSSIAGRLGQGGTAEQSVGFRAQLWKDTVEVIKLKPLVGHGAGAYSLALRRHGNTLGSELAHETYLQLASEIGLIGCFLAVGIIIMWLATVLRRHPSEPPQRTALRYAVVAAVLAIGANGLVESNLSYFGIRVALFALLGIGLNLSVDGLVPERVPSALRAVVAGTLAVGVTYTLVGAALVDDMVARSLASIADGRAGEGQRLLVTARKIAPTDPEPVFQLAKLAAGMNDWPSAAALAQTAAARKHDASSFGLLAQAEAKLGRVDQSLSAIDKAIYAEPIDPYWHAQKFQLLYDMGLYDRAEVAAKEAIESEEKLDAAANALPWLVSTDTITARKWLLTRPLSTRERIRILQSLFDRLADYAEKTAPELARVTGYVEIAEAKKKLGQEASSEDIAKELGMTPSEYFEYLSTVENATIVGESIAVAKQKQELLFETGEELRRAYLAEGNASSADAVRARLEAVEEAGVLK
jgi:O-antigen ligase/tetratricopeptide (TPR) repeat protein